MSATAIPETAISYQEKWQKQALLLYKSSPGISYLILIVTAVHHIFDKEGPCIGSRCTFWQHQAVTSFAQSGIITLVYWVILLALQVIYLLSLWSTEMVYHTVAVKLSAHYIASNLLLVAFMHLWMRQDFWLCEITLVLNFFNLLFAYFMNPTTPIAIHIGTVAGPLAWNFAALYWVGATVVNSKHPVALAVANIAIWGWLACGIFFLLEYKDYSIGFALSILLFSTGLEQFLSMVPVLRLQWIFALVVGSILFVLSFSVSILTSIRYKPSYTNA